VIAGGTAARTVRFSPQEESASPSRAKMHPRLIKTKLEKSWLRPIVPFLYKKQRQSSFGYLE
jgi:hypothetical protein